MSLSITITADSLDEMGDKLSALYQRFAVYPAELPATVTVTAAKPAAARKSAAKPAEPVAAVEEPQEPAESQAEEAPVAEAAKPVAEKAAEPAAEGPLDLDADVAPRVIRAIKMFGKPKVVEVIGEFGGAKVSDLDTALWPELVACFDAGLALADGVLKNTYKVSDARDLAPAQAIELVETCKTLPFGRHV